MKFAESLGGHKERNMRNWLLASALASVLLGVGAFLRVPSSGRRMQGSTTAGGGAHVSLIVESLVLYMCAWVEHGLSIGTLACRRSIEYYCLLHALAGVKNGLILQDVQTSPPHAGSRACMRHACRHA